MMAQPRSNPYKNTCPVLQQTTNTNTNAMAIAPLIIMQILVQQHAQYHPNPFLSAIKEEYCNIMHFHQVLLPDLNKIHDPNYNDNFEDGYYHNNG